MKEPLTIKIFLASGSSSKMRTAEISNWSGKAIACSRGEIKELGSREEAKRPGVYFLIGNNIETGESTVYVGEAEKVTKRLKQHLSKDFWTQVVAFVSKDENLTKAHIKYLEGNLIDIGLNTAKGVILNTQGSGARLPEADQAEMDIFLDRILRLLPVMGTSLFTAPEAINESKQDRLVCATKGIKAYGNRTNNGFIVYKDSQAVLEGMKKSVRTKARREKLVEKGVLTQNDDCLVFTKDYEFTSPSLAAAVVKGGASNGLVAWKNGRGMTLKEVEAG